MAFGGTEGRTRPAKVFGNGRPIEYLSDDEIAVWEYVQHLEREIEAGLAVRHEEPGPLSTSAYVPDVPDADGQVAVVEPEAPAAPDAEEPADGKSKRLKPRSQRT